MRSLSSRCIEGRAIIVNMNDDRSAFASAARQIMRRTELRGIFGLRWRHHALGMLQGELSEDLRVHIWHPRLRDPFGHLFHETPLRAVHDHRFTITSYIVAGQIVDVPYEVIAKGPLTQPYEEMRDVRTKSLVYTETDVYEIAHAKIQDQAARDGKLAQVVGRVLVREKDSQRYTAGDVYTIKRRDFHTSTPVDLAVTIIHRGDFDDRPARVLAGAESAIIPNTSDMHSLRDWVLEQAEDLVADTLRRMK